MVANGFIRAEYSGRNNQQYIADSETFEHVGSILSQTRVETLINDGYCYKDRNNIECPYRCGRWNTVALFKCTEVAVYHVLKLNCHHISYLHNKVIGYNNIIIKWLQ